MVSLHSISINVHGIDTGLSF